jgi:hypothetical protein
MPRSVAVIPAEQQQHRDALGRAITVWMRKNGWSQQTLHDWAKAAGSEGPWNSQISLLQRGKHDPKSLFWVGMGSFNAAVAEQQFPAPASRALKDRLLGSEPFLLDDGTPASATDFFGLFIGEIPIPQAYAATVVFTNDEAKVLSAQIRNAYRAQALERMAPPAEAWDTLLPYMEGLSATRLEQLRSVLSGWSEFDAGDLQDCYEVIQKGMAQWGAAV